MILSGRIVEVSTLVLGDVLTADHAAGATTLAVGATVDFEGAPQVALTDDGGVVYLLPLLAVDDEAETITVASGLPVAFPADSFVAVYPASDDKVAQVVVEDGDDALSARVPHGLFDRIAEGVRDPDAQEAVEVDDASGEWLISDVLGLLPIIDGAYVDPATLPAPEPVLPDPPVAPTLRVTGMPRGLMVQVTNAQPGWSFTYTITDTTTDTTADVTASYPATTRTVFYTETMPDGSPLSVASNGYSFVVTATNEAGSAASAATTPQRLVLNDSSTIAELAVGKLLAGDLVGAFALLGAIKVGASISIDTDDGIVVLQPDGGRIVFPADGTAASISSHLDAFSLTVRDRLKIQGLVNEISAASKVTLATGISKPTAPPVMTRTWDKVPVTFAIGFDATVRGLTRHHSGAGWMTAVVFFGSSLRYVNDAGGGGVTYNLPSGFNADGGVVLIGSRYYVLGTDTNRDSRHFVYVYDTAFAKVDEWEYGWGVNSTKRPAIGVDSVGNVVIVQANSGVTFFRVSTFTVAGSLTATGDTGAGVVQTAMPTGAGAEVRAAVVGSFDTGLSTKRILIATDSALWGFAVDGSRFSDIEFPKAGTSNLLGMWWDGTRFRHLDDASTLWLYETNRTDLVRSVSYSWYDSDTGGTGVHETDRGAAVSWTQAKRSRMAVSTGTPNDLGGNDDPDSVRVWINGFRQPDLGPGVTSATYGATIPTNVTSKAPAFPTTSTAALLDTTAGGWSVDGAGNGSVGTAGFRDSVDARVRAVMPDWRPRTGQQATGTLTAGTPVDLAVTFATPFPSTVDPADIRVVVSTLSPSTVNPLNISTFVNNGSVTRTGFTARVVRSSGTAAVTVTYTAGLVY